MPKKIPAPPHDGHLIWDEYKGWISPLLPGQMLKDGVLVPRLEKHKPNQPAQLRRLASRQKNNRTQDRER